MAILNHILQRRQSLSGGHYGRQELIPGDICHHFKCSHDDEITIHGDITMAPVPALACKFNPNGLHGNLLALVDEEGSVRLIDTRKSLEQSLLKEWRAHSNAIFDINWINNHSLVTASGDVKLSLWDITTIKPIGHFKGHVSSVRCVDVMKDSNAIFVSAGRDGRILLWDTRCYTRDSNYKPVNTINMAHTIEQSKKQTTPNKRRRNSLVNDTINNTTGSNGVTGVLFYKENMIASSGAADGTIKLWDIRRSYTTRTHPPSPLFTFRSKQTSKRVFGFTSLISDCYHSNLYAGCMDHMIYVFDGTTMKANPVVGFSGHKSSFYVKTDLSPCGRFLLSGSSCGNVFIWDTCYPLATPTLLTGHITEVTAVAWSPNQFDKIVTCSDNCDTRIWRCGVTADRYIGSATSYTGTDHEKWCSVLKSVENIPEKKQATDNIQSLRGIKRKHEQQQITTTKRTTTSSNNNSTIDMYWRPLIKQ